MEGIFKVYLLIVCSTVVFSKSSSRHIEVDQERKPVRRFPEGFIWGVGSSSFQIEGGWDADGKGESVWDYVTHHFPGRFGNQSNCDIAADSYHQWRYDVQMLRRLNVQVYRFSISWSRILPTGFVDSVNPAGIQYYNNLIDELLRYNITPFVTIYHIDLPKRLLDLGGWTNSDIIPIFKDYARLLFATFGDRVKLWSTINEPYRACILEERLRNYLKSSGVYPDVPPYDKYMCGYNLLKSHAEAVHLYRQEYHSFQSGRICITFDLPWPQPKTDSVDDKEASERSVQFYMGWFAHPIFSKSGNYPQVMIDRIGNMSKKQGYAKSRLPELTPEEIDWIRGTSDFFSINTYTSNLVTSNDQNNSAGFPVPSFEHDLNVVETQDPNWRSTSTRWLKIVPESMYNVLMRIKTEYNNPEIYITENGASDDNGLEDYLRVEYTNLYLSAVLDAIEDGANVRGYFSWSLMDTFEVLSGYSTKFGFFHVDFNSPNRTRTMKISGIVYAQICRKNAIDWNYKPKLIKGVK